MVAVAGRSKGCHTCKKRRIKCGKIPAFSKQPKLMIVCPCRLPLFLKLTRSQDEGKPACERCSKAKYTCAGYDRPLEFRHATFDSSTKGPGASAGDAPAPTVFNVMINNPKLASPRNELSLVAFREDISLSFLMTNFVWRTYANPRIQMAAKGELGRLPLEASLALSHTNFGNSYNQQQIKVEGLVQYSHVLKALTPFLSDPRKPGVENLIVPIMMLLIHSVSTT